MAPRAGQQNEFDNNAESLSAGDIGSFDSKAEISGRPALPEPASLMEVTHMTAEWPTGIKSAAETAPLAGISEGRLRGLADGGYLPHYRIDGGEPFFKLAEVRKWIAAHLVERIEGKPLPAPVRIVEPLAILQDRSRVPAQLREIRDLCDITGEVRRTGVYILCAQGDILYVGQSANAAARISNHTDKPFESAFFVPWPEDDLDRLEGALIRLLRPPLNGLNKKGSPLGPSGSPDSDAEVLIIIGALPGV